MLKNRLAPYILVSVLIHAGLLFGMHSFLSLPDTQLEPPVLIPVEMLVIRKQPPDPAVRITASEPMVTKKQDSIAWSQLEVDMDADQDSDDIADPIPAEGNYQSSVNLETKGPTRVIRMVSERPKPAGQLEVALSQTLPLHLFPADEQIYEVLPRPKKGDSVPRFTAGTMPTPLVPHTTPKGDEIASEPVNLAIQKTSLHLSAVEPSSPAWSTPSDMSVSSDLVEAKAAVSPHYSQKEKEVASEPVDLAIQKTSLHLSAVEPSSPAWSTPSDMSVSADLVEAKAAVNPHYSQKGKEVASQPVDLAIQKTPLHLGAVEPSSPAGSSPLDSSTSADLAEANVTASPHFFQVSHKAVTSLVDTQTVDDFVAELPPLPEQVEGEPRLMASTLQINGHPNGAQVYVDGMLSGDTPLDMELTLGKHEVRVALPDHYDWKAQIELRETNRSIPISFRLLPVD